MFPLVRARTDSPSPPDRHRNTHPNPLRSEHVDLTQPIRALARRVARYRRHHGRGDRCRLQEQRDHRLYRHPIRHRAMQAEIARVPPAGATPPRTTRQAHPLGARWCGGSGRCRRTTAARTRSSRTRPFALDWTIHPHWTTASWWRDNYEGKPVRLTLYCQLGPWMLHREVSVEPYRERQPTPLLHDAPETIEEARVCVQRTRRRPRHRRGPLVNRVSRPRTPISDLSRKLTAR
jgi:hypothetical protein